MPQHKTTQHIREGVTGGVTIVWTETAINVLVFLVECMIVIGLGPRVSEHCRPRVSRTRQQLRRVAYFDWHGIAIITPCGELEPRVDSGLDTRDLSWFRPVI